MKISKRVHIQREEKAGTWYATFNINEMNKLQDAEALYNAIDGLDAEVSEAMTIRRGKDGKWSMVFTIIQIDDIDEAVELVNNLPKMLAKASGFSTLEEYS